MTFDRLLVAGHSYSSGTGTTGADGSIFNQVDLLYGRFSGLDDTPSVDSTTFAENFSGADAAVATLAGLPAIASAGSAWAVVGNQLQLATNNGGDNVLVADFGVADCVLEIQTPVFGSSGPGACFRYVDDDNFLYVRDFPSLVTAQLWQRVAGVDSQIGSNIASVSGGRFAVCMKGSTITVQSGPVGGATSFNAKFTGVTAGQTATKHGFYASSTSTTGVRWDALRLIDTTLAHSPLTQSLGLWSVRGGCYQLVGQERKGHHFLTKDAGWSDGYVAVVIGTDGGSVGSVFRYVDDSNYCYVQCVTPFASVHKVVAGVDTNLGSVLLTGTTGAVARVDMFGTRIRVSSGIGYAASAGYEFTIADAQFLTATKHGLWINTNAITPPLELRAWSRVYMSQTIGDGVGGTALGPHLVNGRTGGYVHFLQDSPVGLDEDDLAVLMWGINDPPNLGSDARALKGWSGSLRSVIARTLAVQTIEDNDGSIIYSVGDWTAQTGVDRNSGAGWHETSVAGATISIPITTAGGRVAVGALNIHDDAGATATVRLDGNVVGTLDTNGVWSGHTYYGAEVLRFACAAGAHTVTVTVDTVNVSFAFDCVSEGSVTGSQPRVLVANIAKLPAYTAYTSLGQPVDDTAVQAYNDATAAVVAEFPATVQLLDIDAVLGKNADYFASDKVHPNNTGARLIALAILALLGVTPVDPGSTWNGPTRSYAQYVGSNATRAANSLFRHYPAVTQGVNVFIYSDGTVSESAPDGTVRTWDDVAHALWGGHEEPVTAAEATLLTAAGYGGYLS